MRKIKLFFILTIALAGILSAKPNQVFELSAGSVRSIDGVMVAQSNAYMVSEEMYMYADKITYDQKNEEVQLEGNVKIFQGGAIFIDANFVKVNLKDNTRTISPAYLQNNDGLWFSSAQISGKDNVYEFKKGIISGCDIQFPIWHLNTTSGHYNSDSEFLHLWNPRFYLGTLPVFYLPYFSFSTGTKRKTGFLYPEFGYTGREGFVYIQPFFIAPFNQWDITISPQTRTERGNGAYYEFRIADEKNNIATLNFGHFRHGQPYMMEYNLLNRDVFGVEFSYNRRGVFQGLFDDKIRDNFYANISYMNDLEYKRLQRFSGTYNTRLHTSRVNYYAQSDDHYLGVYFKYFNDLSKPSNNSVMQTLPLAQYHKFLDSVFNTFFYSIDATSKNITRNTGYTYTQNSLNVPVGAAMSILGGYININGKVDMYASNIQVGNVQDIKEPIGQTALQTQMDYSYVNYEIAANSDLARSYKYLFHSAHLEARFNAPLYSKASDSLRVEQYQAYSELAKRTSSAALQYFWNPNDIVDMGLVQNKLDLKFSNYFYTNSGRELFYYRIYQRIFTQDEELTKNQLLRQEIGLGIIDGLTISGNVFYSHFVKKFSEASVNVSFNKWGLSSNVNYFFKLNDQILKSGVYDSKLKNSGFLRASASYDFGYFRFSSNVGYDTENRYMKDWYVILSRDIRCFGIALKFAADVRPIQTNSAGGLGTIANQYVKIEFRFVPLAGIGFTQKLQKAQNPY